MDDLRENGSEQDVVIRTRIHLTRNLRDIPFPSKMNRTDRLTLVHKAMDAVEENKALSHILRYMDMGSLSKTEAVSLVERYLVSAEFISDCEGRGVFITDDESMSIMVNEEDHIHIQSSLWGLNLENAYQKADILDDLLNRSLHFAFDKDLGYLTQNPVKLGTGMRASLILHLPALRGSGGIVRISSNLSKLGLSLRGVFETGEDSKGAVYQLSNQVTFGISEQEAIANLKSIATQLIHQERALWEELAEKPEIQDTVSRSLAILQSAKMMAYDEFLQLASNVRFGISVGLIGDIRSDQLNRLIIAMQPATLTLRSGKKLTQNERRILRANQVRDLLYK
ncbi:ATP--guanido phosphotransferase [Caproiciproducens galactitolivorans]|uniref:ATP--guanido phosphotransferase n=1 Tax=Caproiciproducens galactitolivorans TaxID=642589 RepID=A0ABT4BX88_9FIRM|nr:ATP--guanido phosphotransferase [Caproiciproducens galactitolivorans]MCY1714551.1 ATP--guanido phosphotransferase [Caproiciproducens galactitolivorans]